MNVRFFGGSSKNSLMQKFKSFRNIKVGVGDIFFQMFSKNIYQIGEANEFRTNRSIAILLQTSDCL